MKTDAAEARALLNAGLDRFRALGFRRVAPPILQPADVMLEWAGENVRGRAYFVGDDEGEGLCLRTDHTIPTCRLYLEKGGGEARWCYAGSAFRRPQRGPLENGEFLEIGVEILAPDNVEAAERDAAAAALDVLDETGLADISIVAGDLGLAHAFVQGLGLTDEAERDLLARFRRAGGVGEALDALDAPPPEPSALERVLADLPADEARGVLDDVFALAKLRMVGARTVDDVAERMIARARAAAKPPLDADVKAAVRNFFAVEDAPNLALDRLAEVARQAGVDADAALNAARRRFEALTAADERWARACFSPAYGRKLGYYSGFVFEVRHPRLGPRDPVAAGGRYDALLAHLGGPQGAAAIGAMIRPQRLAHALGKAST